MSAEIKPAAERAQWLEQEERGADFWIRALLWWTDTFGRRASWPQLNMIATWYTLRGGEARAATDQFRRRLGLSAGAADYYRQILTFAQTTLDRVFFLRGQSDLFEVSCDGIENLEALAAKKQGAILLGAHLGSFEAARVVGDWQDFPINILVHLGNAKRINKFLRQVSPGFQARLIEVDPAGFGHVFEVQQAIERGEMVAILGDRVGLNEKTTSASFLGKPARFPTGPYVLAATLGCPVYLTFGLYHAPNRYDLYCEPFAERVDLPRKRRQEALEEYAQRYADRLEHHARLAPLNWFNFYDFWDA